MAKKDRSRALEWGRALRPEISNILSAPAPREGSDGDIQVRNTRSGARLFAKLGGRWLSNILYGNEVLDSPDVFIPKVWFDKGTTVASGSVNIIYLPEFISEANIIAVNFGVSVGSNERTYFSLGDALHSSAYNIRVHYNKVDNKVRVEVNGSSTEAKEYTLAVFFK